MGMHTAMSTRPTPLVEYVARWLSKLPAEHDINSAFGHRLLYSASLPISAPELNIFLFTFPKLADGVPIADTGMGTGGNYNMLAETRPAVCIVPMAGGAPSYAMGAYNPAFIVLCRHEYPGSAYLCVQEIIYSLTHKARVFPQNGVIMSMQSQPSLAFGAPAASLHVYQAGFKVMAADKIR